MTTKPALPPISIKFRHIGICTIDIARMEEFYTRMLGFTVTDRGHESGMDIVFLSRDPNDHHQIVLSTGRPEGLPNNVENPMFGPVINQISFLIGSLDDLKKMDAFLDAACPDVPRMHANHGNAWSVYVPDPEGNLIELYADSPWFCHQPTMQPLDLSQSNDEILAATEAVARNGRGFKPVAQWRAEIAREMGAA
jgi:catechol-2,3-dioxygenase